MTFFYKISQGRGSTRGGLEGRYPLTFRVNFYAVREFLMQGNQNCVQLPRKMPSVLLYSPLTGNLALPSGRTWHHPCLQAFFITLTGWTVLSSQTIDLLPLLTKKTIDCSSPNTCPFKEVLSRMQSMAEAHPRKFLNALERAPGCP